jgi:glutamate formiminotransferase / 5-formyltetrahydrofolate cyclo-ligase
VKLLAVPNFSEGRDIALIAALRAELDSQRGLLDRHSDAEHNRTVFTVAGEPDELVAMLEVAAEIAIDRIDMRRHAGLHPSIGALDVSPLVWLREEEHEDARAGARALGQRLGALGVPVFLYGELAADEERRERAFFRRGGFDQLAARMASGELPPDYGPAAPHESAGATLITARPPLAAFNVVLDTPDAAVAQRVAGALREAGGGLPGVRAIGLPMEGLRAQVSTNVHDPISVPLAQVVARIAELAARYGAAPSAAEIVGVVPRAALHDFPASVPLEGFDAGHQVIEERLDKLAD